MGIVFHRNTKLQKCWSCTWWKPYLDISPWMKTCRYMRPTWISVTEWRHMGTWGLPGYQSLNEDVQVHEAYLDISPWMKTCRYMRPTWISVPEWRRAGTWGWPGPGERRWYATWPSWRAPCYRSCWQSQGTPGPPAERKKEHWFGLVVRCSAGKQTNTKFSSPLAFLGLIFYSKVVVHV